MRIRIDLAYDGAPFHGFAKQADAELPTVQGRLEVALVRLLGEAPRTTCAGRTDRGVHALAQVVHLDVDPSLPRAARFVADLAETRDRIDAMCGDPITIWSVTSVDDEFDARFGATSRRYRYRLVDSPLASPLERHLAWPVGERLDDRAMQAAGHHLLGEHDFASFCRRAPGKHTVRRLDRIEVARDRDHPRIAVVMEGPAFCHQQVRSIVGCLVEVGRGRRAPAWLAEVRDARDRGAAAPVAPPRGLVLEAVSYGERWPAAPPASAPPTG